MALDQKISSPFDDNMCGSMAGKKLEKVRLSTIHTLFRMVFFYLSMFIRIIASIQYEHGYAICIAA